MTQSNPLKPIAVACLVLLGLMMTASVLLGSGNQLAALCKYMLVVAFALGAIFPRGSFVFWLVLCGYTDLLKRFMVVSGRISFNDLYYVLGIPPVMLAGMLTSVLLGSFLGRYELRKANWLMLVVSLGLMGATAVLAAITSGGSLGSIVPAVVNEGLYALLIFLTPVLFTTKAEVIQLGKKLLWIFFPVALYGIYQRAFGFQDFEIAYLRSGLTIEIKQLVFNEVRAFSTLNSPTALAAISAVLCVLALVLTFVPRRAGERRPLHLSLCIIFTAAYTGSLVASTGRAGFIVLGLGIFGYLCLSSPSWTKALYVSTIFVFLTLIFMADKLLLNLDVVQNRVTEVVGDGQFADQMTRVGTYSDRLMGFSNLVKNPKIYTFFGHGAEAAEDSTLYSHDMLTSSLVKYGVVPILLIILVTIWMLRVAHRSVFAIQGPQQRKLAAGLMALPLSLLAMSMLAGSVLVVFPVNMFMWLFCGLFVVTVRSEPDDPSTSEAEVEPVRSWLNQAATGEPTYRFSRSGSASS